MRRRRLFLVASMLLALLSASVRAEEGEPEFVGPYPGTVSWPTDYSFRELLARLKKSITANGLTLLAVATAERRSPPLEANATLIVFRNDYAARIIEANELAGMEAPIRFYVTERTAGKASVTYRTPSSILALYDSPKLDTLAAELDQLFAKIVDDALGG